MSDKNPESFAKLVAQAVLHRLGNQAPDWKVLDVVREENENASPPLPDLPQARNLKITLGPANAPEDKVVEVRFSLDVARQFAVLALASQIQDHAIEATGGLPMPPCPGHAHPMSPTLLANSSAVWSCPLDPSRPQVTIDQT